MVTKGERIRLGFFLFIGIVLILAFVFLTVGKELLKKNDLYYIEYSESISGLNVGNPVKRNGVEIGQVDELSFAADDVTKILVRISIKKGIAIKSDAQAVVHVFGITGIKYIDIVKESNSSPRLNPGDYIQSGLSAIDMVTGKADIIMQKIEVVLNNLVAMTGGVNANEISHTLASINQLAIGLNQMVAQNKDNVAKFTAQLPSQGMGVFGQTNKVLSRLDSAISDADRVIKNESLVKTFKNMETISGDIKDGLGQGKLGKSLDNLNKTLEASTRTINEANKTIVTSRERVNQILDRLEVTIRNLADFTQTIKDNPSLLIRKQE